MGFSVNTNIPAMNSNLDLNASSLNSKKILASIATALKINSAADDASGMAIANRLTSQASVFAQEIMNANESIGMIQIADGAMGQIGENMEKMKTLSVQASSGILDSNGRSMIQKEINALQQATKQTVDTTSYNGLNLLSGSSGSLNLQVDSLASFAVDVTTTQSTATSMELLDKAMESIGTIRADLGSAQNQLESKVKNIATSQINSAAAASEIKDVDFARESANFSKNNLLLQSGSLVQSHANISNANMGVLL